MKITGTMDCDSFLKAQSLHLRPRPIVRALGYIWLLLVAWVLVKSYRIAFMADGSFGPAIVTTFIIIFLFFQFFVLRPRKLKKLFKQQKSLHDEFELDLTEETYSVTTDKGNFSMQWADFHKWKENKNMILVYHSDILFQSIPKNTIITDNDIEWIRSILHNRISFKMT